MGIEWCNSYLKLVSLKKNGGDYKLHKLEQLAIPQFETEESSKILAQWVAQNFPKDSKISAYITIPESSVFLKEIEVPEAKEKELSEAVFWEVVSVASMPADQIVVQWRKISQAGNLVRVAAIAAKDEAVDYLLSVVKGAGLKVLGIEPSSLAFARLSPECQQKTTLLVIAEEEETNFVILKNGAPVFSNSIPEYLAGMKTKRRKLDREIVSSLATNAKKVIAFWEEKGEGKVQQVVITGRGIRYSGLASEINKIVHLPAGFGKLHKLEKVEIPPSSKIAIKQYLVPLGAAVKPTLEPEAEAPEVNLMPGKERLVLEKEGVQKAAENKTLIFSQISLCLVLLMIVAFVGVTLFKASLDREIAQTKLFVNNHPAQKLLPEVQAANKLISQTDLLMTNQKDMGEKLLKISQLIPPSLRLTTLGYTGTKGEDWKIAGVGDRETVLAFYEKLKADSGASQVTMPYSNLQKEKGGDFIINLIW